MKEKSNVVEISSMSVIKVVLIIIGFVAAWIIKPVLLMVFIAFIFSSAFKPYVNFLEKYKIPRIISTLAVVLIFFFVGIFGLVTIVNEALIQLRALIQLVPDLVYSIISGLEKVFPIISQYVDPDTIKLALLDGAKNLLSVGPAVLGSGVSGAFEFVNNTVYTTFMGILVLIMSIYMMVRKDNVYDGFLMLINKTNRKGYRELLNRIELKVGEWMRTQLFIMMVVGFVMWLGLIIPGFFVKDYTLGSFALPIAFLAMMLEIVPGTGVAVGGILAAVIALALNQPYIALYVGIFAIILVQFETNFLIPNVMKKVVGIDPILTMSGFFAFYMLFGILGAVLVVPILIVLQFLVDFGVDGVIDSV